MEAAAVCVYSVCVAPLECGVQGGAVHCYTPS